MLDGVDQLLQECKGLLNNSSSDVEVDEIWVKDQKSSDQIVV